MTLKLPEAEFQRWTHGSLKFYGPLTGNPDEYMQEVAPAEQMLLRATAKTAVLASCRAGIVDQDSMPPELRQSP